MLILSKLIFIIFVSFYMTRLERLPWRSLITGVDHCPWDTHLEPLAVGWSWQLPTDYGRKEASLVWWLRVQLEDRYITAAWQELLESPFLENQTSSSKTVWLSLFRNILRTMFLMTGHQKKSKLFLQGGDTALILTVPWKEDAI